MRLTDKGILIGLGVVAIGVGVYFGVKKARKNKAKKEAATGLDFDAMMKKQYEEEMNNKVEQQVKNEKCTNETDNLVKKAEDIVSNNPVTREDLAEIVAKDPEFIKILAKYVSPVEAMAMKHMPSKEDIANGCKDSVKVEEFKNEIGLNNGYNRSESVAGITKYVKDYNRGLEYDVKMPIDSVYDISNTKPLEEPNKIVEAIKSIDQEVYETIGKLSESDQISLAKGVFSGQSIMICGKQITLSDIPVFNIPIQNMSPNVTAAVSEMISQHNATNTVGTQPIQPVQTQQYNQYTNPFIERGTPMTPERMAYILAEQTDAEKANQELQRRTAEEYNKWLNQYKER